MTEPEDDSAPEGDKPDDREWVSTEGAIRMVREAYGWKLSKPLEAIAWLLEQSVKGKVAFSIGSGPVTDLALFIERQCSGSPRTAAKTKLVRSDGLWDVRQLEELLRSEGQDPDTAAAGSITQRDRKGVGGPSPKYDWEALAVPFALWLHEDPSRASLGFPKKLEAVTDFAHALGNGTPDQETARPHVKKWIKAYLAIADKFEG